MYTRDEVLFKKGKWKLTNDRTSDKTFKVWHEQKVYTYILLTDKEVRWLCNDWPYERGIYFGKIKLKIPKDFVKQVEEWHMLNLVKKELGVS